MEINTYLMQWTCKLIPSMQKFDINNFDLTGFILMI